MRLLILAVAPVVSVWAEQAPSASTVMQWSAEATPSACERLTNVLTNDSFDLRARAASALYWRCDRTAAVGYVAKLCRSLDLGNPEAGAVLLLGYARADAAFPCL